MLPNSCPILSAEDIFQGSWYNYYKFTTPKEISSCPCCLLGHVNRLVYGYPSPQVIPLELRTQERWQDVFEVKKTLRLVLREELQDKRGELVFFNDSCSDRNLIARVWNRAMYLLGYTEGNPERKPLKAS